MAKCGNCGTKLGCSCKMRKAKDGRSCCVNCVASYNTKLRVSERAKNAEAKASNTDPIIIGATAKQKD